MRGAEPWILRQLDRSKLDQRVQQLVDRRFSQLRIGGLCRPPDGAQLQPQDASRRESETVVSGLAVHEESTAARGSVGDAGAVASTLFADDKDQPDSSLSLAAKEISRRDLSGQN